jgi:membrane protein
MQRSKSLVAQVKLRVERARTRFAPFDAAVRVFRRFSEDDGGFYAAALTYYTFFSIFPLLLFAGSAVGYLTFVSEAFRERLLEAGVEAFPLLDSIITPEVIDNLQERRGTLALTGLALALYSGSGGVTALGHALSRMAHTPLEGSFLSRRLASLKWIAVLGAAAVVSVALGVLANYTEAFLGNATWARIAGSIAGYAIGLGLGVVIFATAFRFLTRRAWSWREVLPGAVVAAVAFEVLKAAGAWYMSRGVAARQQTFGAFAGAAGLLVASYLLAQITLLSAEVNAVLRERRQARRSSTT